MSKTSGSFSQSLCNILLNASCSVMCFYEKIMKPRGNQSKRKFGGFNQAI